MSRSRSGFCVVFLVAAGCGDTREASGDASSGIDAGAETGAGASTSVGDGTTDGTGEGSGSTTGGDDGGQTSGVSLKYDVGHTDVGGCGIDNGGAAYDFSVIWIANSPQGTVSKIDTRTGDELGRFRTGPGSDPDPSRTSVNLDGNVAVANRGGSVTMIATRIEQCVDRDGDQVIQTSSGADDVLAWDADECVIWHHDLPFSDSNHTGGPRAVAWDAGIASDDPCASAQPRVWVGWRDKPDDAVVIRRLHGQDGALDDETRIEPWQGNWSHGTYGGAVDGAGNFWAIGTLGTLVRVDAESFDIDRWENAAGHITYGLALDAAGNPWLAGWDGKLFEFDVNTEQFIAHGNVGPSRLRGLAIDAQGYAWIAGNNGCALAQYDTTTNQIVDGQIALPGCATPVGVSIDVDGNVWVVDKDASLAYRVDPDTYAVDSFDGLTSPYTYSDMTGAGLNLVVNPPG